MLISFLLEKTESFIVFIIMKILTTASMMRNHTNTSMMPLLKFSRVVASSKRLFTFVMPSICLSW